MASASAVELPHGLWANLWEHLDTLGFLFVTRQLLAVRLAQHSNHSVSRFCPGTVSLAGGWVSLMYLSAFTLPLWLSVSMQSQYGCRVRRASPLRLLEFFQQLAQRKRNAQLDVSLPEIALEQLMLGSSSFLKRNTYSHMIVYYI